MPPVLENIAPAPAPANGLSVDAEQLSQHNLDPSFRERYLGKTNADATQDQRGLLESANQRLPEGSPLGRQVSTLLSQEEAIARNPSAYSSDMLANHQAQRDELTYQLNNIERARPVIAGLAESLKQTEDGGRQFNQLVEGWDDGSRSVRFGSNAGQEQVVLGRTDSQPEVIIQPSKAQDSPAKYFPDTDSVQIPPDTKAFSGAQEYSCALAHEMDHRSGYMEQVAHERLVGCMNRTGAEISDGRPQSVEEVTNFIQSTYDGNSIVASAIERQQGKVGPELMRELPGGDLYLERANNVTGPNSDKVRSNLLDDSKWSGFVASGARDYYSGHDYPGTTLEERASPEIRNDIDSKTHEVTSAYLKELLKRQGNAE